MWLILNTVFWVITATPALRPLPTMGLLITSFEHFQGRLFFAENVRSLREIILLASTPGGIHQVLVLGESLTVLESVF